MVITEARHFIDGVVEHLPALLRDRIDALGADADRFEAEVALVMSRTADGLEDLLARPFDRQPATPLEVVRGSVEPITSALEALGIGYPGGDRGDDAPGDPYGLAPVSAAELGEDVLRASLAWGLAKTAALARPTLLVVTSNLMDASRFEGVASAAGYRLESGRDAAGSVTPLVAFVDLEHAESDAVIRSLAREGVRVVAYGPHVDDHALVRAMALGAESAEPRSRLFRDPSAFLPPLV